MQTCHILKPVINLSWGKSAGQNGVNDRYDRYDRFPHIAKYVFTFTPIYYMPYTVGGGTSKNVSYPSFLTKPVMASEIKALAC